MGYHPLKSCEKIKNNLVEVSNFYKKNKINYNEVKKKILFS